MTEGSHIGPLIAAARRRKNLGQKDVAQRLHMKRETLSYIERGLSVYPLHPRTVNTLSQMLDVPVLDFVLAEGYDVELPLGLDDMLDVIHGYQEASTDTQNAVRRVLNLPLTSRTAPTELRVAEERDRYGA